MSGEQPTQVKVGWLELSDSARKQVVMDRASVKSFLVSGFRDEIEGAIKTAREAWEKETDPSTRPGNLGQPAVPDTLEIDIKRFGGLRRAVVDKATGSVLRWADASTALTSTAPAGQSYGTTEGGFMPPLQLSADERETIGKEFATFVADRSRNGNQAEQASFSLLRFPRGDIENFSICRWAMACERSKNTNEDNLAYSKHAPWERAYYAALEAYALTKGEAWLKAQGDMVSGQDGGWLAPEQ